MQLHAVTHYIIVIFHLTFWVILGNAFHVLILMQWNVVSVNSTWPIPELGTRQGCSLIPVQLQGYKLTPKWIKWTKAIKSTGAEML